jgi:HAD superfamily hydrolase (TIGR01549 family)
MPQLTKYNAVIFDLDGTLIQSKIDYEEMRRRVIEIISEMGVSIEGISQSRKIWEIIQGSERVFNEIGIKKEAKEMISRRINEALNEIELSSLETVEPTRNSEEMLRALRSEGFKIGVATRGCKKYALCSLKKTGLKGYVDAILARDEVEHPKPDPRHLIEVAKALECPLNRVVYIGDTTTDLSTAQGAGVTFVGFFRKDEWGKRLKEAGCRVFVEDLLELVDIVKSLD